MGVRVAVVALLVAIGCACGGLRAEGVKKTYSGVLVDAGGAAIGGVKFKVFHWEEVGVARLEMEGAADGAGRFAVGPVTPDPVGTINRTVLFDVPGKAWGLWLPEEGRPGLALEARVVATEATRVAGVVRDEAGKPVAGAEVTLWVQGMSMGYLTMGKETGLGVTTDGAGRFVFERVPAGTRSHVSVVATGFAAFSTRDGYGEDIHPVKAGTEDVEIELQREAVLRVQLVEGGKAVARAGVVLRAGGRGIRGPSAVTDGSGAAELLGLRAGTWGVFPVVKEGDAGMVPVRGIVVAKGQREEVRMEAGIAGEVRGEVRDEETGAAVGGQMVWLSLPGEVETKVATAKSAADGTFVMKAPAGKFAVTTYGWAAKRGTSAYRTAAVEVKAGERPAAVRLAMHPRPMLHGELVDEAGKPVAGRVMADFSAVETDGAGKFVLPEPNGFAGEGIAVLAVDKAGKLGRGLVVRAAGELEGVKLVLSPMGAIEGQVVDKAGHGAPDAVVQLSILMPGGGGVSPGEWLWTTKMEADGKFRIAPVPTGYRLHVIAEREGMQALRVVEDLAPEEERDLAQLVIHEGGPATQMANPKLGAVKREVWDGEIAGRVVDGAGKPVAGARVSFMRGVGTDVEDTTDLKGRFGLKGVPQGEVTVRVGKSSGPSREWKVKSGDLAAEYRLLPQAGELVGKPALGLMVDSWLAEGPHGWDELKGKVVLVQTGVYPRNYRPEMTRALYEKYKDKGLVVVTVLSRAYGTPAGDLKAWAAEHQMTWAVGVDAEEWAAPAGVKRGGWGATEDLTEGAGEFLVDKAGVWRGAVDETEGREAAVVRLLEE